MNARFPLLVAVVLVAFASNSVLNRMAVGPGHIDPMAFAIYRAIAGAVMLGALVLIRRRSIAWFTAKRAVGATSLTLYLIGFSIAYVSIDAGLGALLLFGAVQVTMFAGGVMGGERPPTRRWIGAGLAFAGLAWLSWPSGAAAVSVIHATAMLVAGVGWGVYSLAGRTAQDPLAETAGNFMLAAPLLIGLAMLLPVQLDGTPTSGIGIALAILAGAVTSGLGYALWYAVLPKLGPSTSALLQLTVPIIATLGGVVLLSEVVTWRMVGAGVLTLGGIAYGLGAFQRTKGSSGS